MNVPFAEFHVGHNIYVAVGEINGYIIACHKSNPLEILYFEFNQELDKWRIANNTLIEDMSSLNYHPIMEQIYSHMSDRELSKLILDKKSFFIYTSFWIKKIIRLMHSNDIHIWSTLKFVLGEKPNMIGYDTYYYLLVDGLITRYYNYNFENIVTLYNHSDDLIKFAMNTGRIGILKYLKRRYNRTPSNSWDRSAIFKNDDFNYVKMVTDEC